MAPPVPDPTYISRRRPEPGRPPGPAPLRSGRVLKPTRNPLRRWWRRVADPARHPLARAWSAVAGPLAVGVVLGLLGAAAVLGYAAALVSQTPDAYKLARATQAQPSQVYAASGERLTQFETPFHRWVPLDSIPVPLVDALLATEDRRFYAHGGIDVRRTVGAALATARGRREGGSTVTQQLARNLFPEEIGRSGTVRRKLMEAIAAVRIERDHTKREILEAYLNTVPFLYNAHGVEMAARTYFATNAPELTVEQGATLVAMLKGPAEFNPVRRPEAALARRNLVLRLMAQQGDLPAAEAAALQETPLGVDLRPQPGTQSRAPHFTAAVRREVEAWATPRGYDVERDGLVVRTTLHLSAQRAAEAAVAERIERLQRTANREWPRGAPRAAVDAELRRTDAFAAARAEGLDEDAALERVRDDRALVAEADRRARRVEAALVAIEPATGAVRAYVGGRDFRADEYDRAGVALRQPGSTFKAFVYAAALQRGYAPDDVLDGGAAEVELSDGTTWRPEGGTSGGTLEDAFAFSKNAAAARLTQEVGPHRVALVAQRMGVTSRLDVVPSIGLGTSSVTLLEMVSAYATAANDGLRRAPRLVTQIEDARGRVLATFAPEGAQAITRRDARQLTDLMRAVVTRGTGAPLRGMGVTGDVVGKTGTTQRYADGWFIAMRPGLAVGAWVGFNDPRVTFRSMATGSGGATALPVVGAFLRRVQGSLPDLRFPPPDGFALPPASDSTWFGEPFEEPDLAEIEEPVYDTPPDAPDPRIERPEADEPRLRSDGEGRIGW